MLSYLEAKFTPILEKLKREWKTFTLAVATTVAGAWEFAVQLGADLPSLFNWVPEQYKSATLFLVGLAFLLLRKYTPTTVIVQEKVTEVSNTPETSTVAETTKVTVDQ